MLKKGKVACKNEVTGEMIKNRTELVTICNKIFGSRGINDWRTTVIILLCKDKGEITDIGTIYVLLR